MDMYVYVHTHIHTILTYKNAYIHTYIHMYIYTDNIAVLDLLIRSGANLARVTADFLSETAMHCAARGGATNAIRRLAEAGATHIYIYIHIHT